MFLLTCLSFMNHCNIDGGCDLPDVQFKLMSSPISYCVRSPVMCGPSLGRSKINKKIMNK